MVAKCTWTTGSVDITQFSSSVQRVSLIALSWQPLSMLWNSEYKSTNSYFYDSSKLHQMQNLSRQFGNWRSMMSSSRQHSIRNWSLHSWSYLALLSLLKYMLRNYYQILKILKHLSLLSSYSGFEWESDTNFRFILVNTDLMSFVSWLDAMLAWETAVFKTYGVRPIIDMPKHLFSSDLVSVNKKHAERHSTAVLTKCSSAIQSYIQQHTLLFVSTTHSFICKEQSDHVLIWTYSNCSTENFICFK